MIRWAYTNPASPACFSRARNVLRLVRQHFPKTTLRHVEDVLIRIPAYTLHKNRRVRFKRLMTVPTGYMTDLQVDLADFQKVADENDGFKYILVRQKISAPSAPTKKFFCSQRPEGAPQQKFFF